MARTLTALLVIAALASPAHADDPVGTEAAKVEVGQTARVALGGLPTKVFRCDDVDVVKAEIVVDGGRGYLALSGLKVGSTLCSVTSVADLRRLFRVTVVRPAPPPDAGVDGGS